MSRLINETGNVYHWLTVVRRVYKDNLSSGENHAFWLCKCKCGNEITVCSQNLRRKTYKSCGCYGNKDPNRHKKKPEIKKSIDTWVIVNLIITFICVVLFLIFMLWI